MSARTKQDSTLVAACILETEMMPKSCFVLSLLTLLTLLASTSAQDAQRVNKRSTVASSTLRNTRLTHAAFSPDGNRIAIAWFTPARNRPGTDWSTGVALWDLETSGASILADATGAVAFSPDGETVLAARFERSRMGPNVHGPALWTFGKSEAVAECSLGRNFQPLDSRSRSRGVPMMAAAFHPNGKHAVVVTARGALLVWNLETPGRVVCRDVLHFADEPSGFLPGVLRFNERGTRLVLLKLPTSQYQDRRLTHVVTWNLDIDKGRFERQSAYRLDVLHDDPKQRTAAGMKLDRENDGKLLTMADEAGNRINFDFENYSVTPALASPDGKALLTCSEEGPFLLVDVESSAPLYRLIPGRRPENVARTSRDSKH